MLDDMPACSGEPMSTTADSPNCQICNEGINMLRSVSSIRTPYSKESATVYEHSHPKMGNPFG